MCTYFGPMFRPKGDVETLEEELTHLRENLKRQTNTA